MPIVEHDGLNWIVNEDEVDGRLGPSNHESDLAPYFETDGVFLDIGADVGRWTLRVARTAAHVYALEPHPGRCKRLLDNATLNKIDNLTVFPWAASDHHDRELIGRTGQLGEGTEVTHLYPIDDMVRFSRLDLIKIDIEGFELEALHGLKHTLERHKPRMIIETHDSVRPGSWAPAAALLDHYGYAVRDIGSLGGQGYVEATIR